MRPYGKPKQLEQRRLKAAALLREGVMPAAVARIMRVSEASVSRWRRALEANGEAALAAKPHPGHARKLSAAQERKLQRILPAGAVASGYANELWTAKRVAEVIRRRFGAKYCQSGVWRLLRRMGWDLPEARASRKGVRRGCD